MGAHQVRWILAFDASCATCREISSAVSEAGRDRLEVLPLSHTYVRERRAAALGADAPQAPTLIKVTDGTVQAWTGIRMAVPLARRLGPLSTVRIISALGTLRRRALGHDVDLPGHEYGRKGMARAQFLRLGAGAAVAVGLLATGRTPAFASQEQATATKWVAAHKDILPAGYSEFSAYPMAYRRAIFQAATPKVRSQLWMQHLARYRASHPALSAEQGKVIDRTTALVGRMFNGDVTAFRGEAEEIRKAAIAAFGFEEAGALVATLGPENASTQTMQPALADCSCCSYDTWCGFATCEVSECNYSNLGCGFAWSYPCDGFCV